MNTDITYYLVDDTLQIREVHTPNDERDPFPVLLQRQRVQIGEYPSLKPTYDHPTQGLGPRLNPETRP